MTGMKKGAGEDPFAEDPDPEAEATESDEATSQTGAGETTADSGSDETSENGAQSRSIQIPYKFRRDGVQDGRSRVPLFLQSETKAAEREALRELEDRFDDDVSLTDLREALVMVGLEHLDEAETTLESWGYGMTFE